MAAVAQTAPWKKKRKWRPRVLIMVGTMEERSTMVQPLTSCAIEAPMFLLGWLSVVLHVVWYLLVLEPMDCNCRCEILDVIGWI